jgi:hypothetical protein
MSPLYFAPAFYLYLKPAQTLTELVPNSGGISAANTPSKLLPNHLKYGAGNEKLLPPVNLIQLQLQLLPLTLPKAYLANC